MQGATDMAKKRKATVDDLYDRRYRNDPESRGLTEEEKTLFEAARQAIGLLKKTFETWMVIGKAVQAARARANRLGGGKTFRRILEQQGLARIVPPATATRLLQIIGHLPEVSAWHASLNDQQQVAWASPSAVFKHCPVFADSKAATRKPSPKGTRARPTSSQDPWEARAVYAEWLKDAPRDARAVEVAQFMADVGIRLPDLLKAREYLGYREKKSIREEEHGHSGPQEGG
jgi:hypothetical protein